MNRCKASEGYEMLYAFFKEMGEPSQKIQFYVEEYGFFVQNF